MSSKTSSENRRKNAKSDTRGGSRRTEPGGPAPDPRPPEHFQPICWLQVQNCSIVSFSNVSQNGGDWPPMWGLVTTYQPDPGSAPQHTNTTWRLQSVFPVRPPVGKLRQNAEHKSCGESSTNCDSTETGRPIPPEEEYCTLPKLNNAVTHLPRFSENKER